METFNLTVTIILLFIILCIGAFTKALYAVRNYPSMEGNQGYAFFGKLIIYELISLILGIGLSVWMVMFKSWNLHVLKHSTWYWSIEGLIIVLLLLFNMKQSHGKSAKK